MNRLVLSVVTAAFLHSSALAIDDSPCGGQNQFEASEAGRVIYVGSSPKLYHICVYGKRVGNLPKSYVMVDDVKVPVPGTSDSFNCIDVEGKKIFLHADSGVVIGRYC